MKIEWYALFNMIAALLLTMFAMSLGIVHDSTWVIVAAWLLGSWVTTLAVTWRK